MLNSGLLKAFNPKALKSRLVVPYRPTSLKARYASLLEKSGLHPSLPLIDQKEQLNAITAPMIIFELLFLLTEDKDHPRRSLDRYMDLIDWFYPDDHVYVGVLEHTLLPVAMRNADLAAARRLVSSARVDFETASCDYLIAFIHLHKAIIRIAKGDLSAARPHLESARVAFVSVADVPGEIAMVDLTRAWIDVEQDNRLPRDWLLD